MDENRKSWYSRNVFESSSPCFLFAHFETSYSLPLTLCYTNDIFVLSSVVWIKGGSYLHIFVNIYKYTCMNHSWRWYITYTKYCRFINTTNNILVWPTTIIEISTKIIVVWKTFRIKIRSKLFFLGPIMILITPWIKSNYT